MKTPFDNPVNVKEYTDRAISMLLDKNGAFFAFGNDQFNEKKKEGVIYVSLGAGLICPKENTKIVIIGINKICSNSIKKDIKTNGITNIIKRELINYECYYVGDISACVDALKDYGITREEILKVYHEERQNHD